MEPIRVLVVDDDDLAETLSQVLPRRSNVQVLGSVADPLDAAARFEDGSVDVALLDLDRAGAAGVGYVERIREGSDRARVLVITDEDRPEVLAEALGAGACGFVPRMLPTEELVRRLHRATAGELVMPERDLHRVVGRLRRGVAPAADGERVASLTERETEILRTLADGRSAAEIAASLGISPLTVQSHVKSILAKLGVHSKVEAVTFAWRSGLAASTRSA
jgi:DNA-binding NarL/FixJ family response regulator